MDKRRLEAAIEEAERFLDRSRALVRLLDEDEMRVETARARKEQAWRWDFPVQSGATKRASMDLTRALADLRRR